MERFAPKQMAAPVRSATSGSAARGSDIAVWPGRVDPRGAGGGRRTRPVVLPVGHLRHLRRLRVARPDRSPDHRDSLLTEDEPEAEDTMLICVSRFLDDELVLDI